ncbi:DUF763 domain-containing protein [Occallatibacter riparius]|uniref:DUF763 domain-containing protein n=1 Tax=Occallatibacter riparius TaxID=1002689 RepID=A0A9J7BP76_9BACT|nr:DUF763 domain-containing protein [Occallatibacter riparius]UWZ82726.1 DUF763 domain-containing protein [Occallatibacter riparius]
MKRSGTADLPLHGGRVPQWLATRMTELGTAITEQIVLHYGPSEFLSRLSDPFWFQAFGAVMGMDWHSSGITTSVMGALKRGLNPRLSELGFQICGGRGRHSKRTPDELRDFSARSGLDGNTLARTSRLTARIDNNAIADGFQLYLHTFVIHTSGEWSVIQQGMNDATGLARRYHWHSPAVRDFVHDPHTAILGRPQGEILNLVDSRATSAQQALLTIAGQPVQASIDEARRLVMPRHHDVRAEDVDLKRLGAVLAVAHEQDLRDFASLLLVEGLGPRTLQSLALIAEVVHGAPSRFSDPARFSWAHGGKDGHPFPVPLKTYDESLAVLRRSLDATRLGHTEKSEGFRRLDKLTRAVEQNRDPLADFTAALEHEREISPSLNGRTVFDDRRSARRKPADPQLPLFPAQGFDTT